MDKTSLVKEALDTIFSYLGINPEYTLSEVESEDGGDSEGDNNNSDRSLQVEIEGDELSFLIGYHGESLDAIQSFLNTILLRKVEEKSDEPRTRVMVDINDYRKRRSEKILDITKSFIDRVRFMQQDMEMPPMKPSERREVHILITDYPDIDSESTGERFERHVVLKLKQ